MLRDPASYKNATMTVTLKDGTVFSRRDITSAPFGDRETFVCFWDNDDIKLVPIQNVSEITMHF